MFRRLERSRSGKGHYWCLNIVDGEGYKRTRKRRPFIRKSDRGSKSSTEIKPNSNKEEDELSSENGDGQAGRDGSDGPPVQQRAQLEPS